MAEPTVQVPVSLIEHVKAAHEALSNADRGTWVRELADNAEKLLGDSDYDEVFIVTVVIALRTAADQLEAVREYIEALPVRGGGSIHDELMRILTADTAPQEDRDE